MTSIEILKIVAERYNVNCNTGVITSSKGDVITSTTNRGYINICTTIAGKKVNVLGHRLVAFVGGLLTEDNFNLVINHKNGKKTDNSLDNLEVCTKAYNSKHAVDTGLIVCKGEDNPASKLTWEKVSEIRHKHSIGISYSKLVIEYGVSKTQIANIVNNKQWYKG